MEPAHLGSGNRIGTIVFVDIVQYSEESVSGQAAMKARFGAILASALEHTPAADRLVLDTGDGAALCFFGDPEDALFAANALRGQVLDAPGARGLQLRIGINLGPVRLVKDINGHGNVIGDGINVAQRVMSFAEPNQILVSRSYYEVVSRLAPDYALLFQYVGLHRDKHVREHEVYEVHLSPPAPRRAEEAPDAEAAAPAGRPAPSAGRPSRLDPEFVERLAAALAGEIGPVAKLVVRRAADRAADERALGDAVAEHVPPARRAAFVAALADLPRAPRGAADAPARGGAPQPPPDPRPGGPIDAEVLARAERLLTSRIGPVARILVRQAAKHASGARELFESLAIHINDPAVRKAFLAEAERFG